MAVNWLFLLEDFFAEITNPMDLAKGLSRLRARAVFHPMLFLSLLSIQNEFLEPLEFILKIYVLMVQVDSQHFSVELNWHHYCILNIRFICDLQTW